MAELAKWDSFYAVVGSAAGALIGLQFVAMALIVDRPINRSQEAGAAFATPMIVHFCTALLRSGLLLVPWPSIKVVAVAWGLVGLGGVPYALIVARRMGKQPVYRPVFEDWFNLIGRPERVRIADRMVANQNLTMQTQIVQPATVNFSFQAFSSPARTLYNRQFQSSASKLPTLPLHSPGHRHRRPRWWENRLP